MQKQQRTASNTTRETKLTPLGGIRSSKGPVFMGASRIPLVFFLEENANLRQKLQHTFNKLGVQNIQWFSKEKECISHLEEHPDIIIQDKTYDETGGYTLLYEAKKFSPDSKYYFFCSKEDSKYAEKGLKIGADEIYIRDNQKIEDFGKWINQKIISKRLKKFYFSVNVGMFQFFGIILFLLLIVLSVVFLNPKMF